MSLKAIAGRFPLQKYPYKMSHSKILIRYER